MKSSTWILLTAGLVILYAPSVRAQLKGTNLAEFQYGNIPGMEPSGLTSLYNQLNLSYRHKFITIKGRIETFQPSHSEERSYTRLSQFSAKYSREGLYLQAGSIYQTIGRGILLRNYELPSSIWEDIGYRVRYGFYKDLQGLSAGYTSENFQVKLMRGRVLAVDLPPTFERLERRPDLVEAAEANYTLKDHTLGLAFMRQTNQGASSNYATAYLEGFINYISYYAEYAFGNNDARAIYGSLAFSGERIGISLEYKDYKNFLIGTGISDPPTLVKEHSSRLLNRSTHVPILSNESGYQADISFQINPGNRINLNHSLAKNILSEEISYTFSEYYIDLESFINETWYGKVFGDYSRDPFKAENQRITAGIILEKELNEFTVGTDLEAQSITRDFGESQNLVNYYASLSLKKGSKYGVTAIFEISDDPFLLDEGETQITYPGIIFDYQPVHSTKLSLFAGKRRGGPACNSGVCYEVLDFEGIELRISTIF